MNNIKKSQKKASEELKMHVYSTVNTMIANGENINFYTVSKKAEVSRTFLYKHDDTRRIIEQNRFTKLSKQELQKELSKMRTELLLLEIKNDELKESTKS